MKNLLRVLGGAAVAAVLGFALSASSATPPHRSICECADIYAPVICSNGVVYPNACMAACVHASGCVPYNP